MNKLLILGTVAVFGMTFFDHSSVNAREITVPEAMTLNSTIEGYEFLLWGLQSLEGFNAPIEEQQNWSMSFDSLGTNSFTASGLINGKTLNLTYSGSLSGTFGSTDMSWLGTWTGSLGSESISATDTATWIYDSGLGLYTDMDFSQQGSLGTPDITQITPSGFKFWSVIGLEVLGTVAGGVATGGWGAAAAGSGLVLGSYAILEPSSTPPAPPPRPPRPPEPIPSPTPPVAQKTNNITINNQGGTINGFVALPGSNVTVNGDINSPTTGPSTATGSSTIKSIPEPTLTLGLLVLGTLGAGTTLKRKLKPSKLTEKETMKVG